MSTEENKRVSWVIFARTFLPPRTVPWALILTLSASPAVLLKQIGPSFPLTFRQLGLDLDLSQATWPSSSFVHIIFMMFILNRLFVMFLNQFLSLALFLFGLVDVAELKNPRALTSCEPVETLIKVTHCYWDLKIWPLCFSDCGVAQNKKDCMRVSAMKKPCALGPLPPPTALVCCPCGQLDLRIRTCSEGSIKCTLHLVYAENGIFFCFVS